MKPLGVLKISDRNFIITLGLLLIAFYSIAITNEFYWLFVFPVVLIVGLLAFYAIDTLIILTTFLTPLAINLRDTGYGLGLSLPAEPLIILLMLIYLFKLINGERFDKDLYRHPITIAIFLNLFWMFVTTITSELPIVSFKFLLSRLWFVLVFYFMVGELFKEEKHIKSFIWAYIVGLFGIIIFTIIHHSQYSFSESTAHWVMSPFYNDHTAYAAAIAMFLPFSIILIKIHKNPLIKFFAVIVTIVFCIGIVLSYTRAAWVSLIIALAVYMCLLFRIKFSLLLFAGLVMAVAFFTFQTQIKQKLEKNRQDSSSDYTAHIKSITNISTDASNLERINRWHSAFKMFEKRPFFGWGPGTYMFLYAPFQNSQDLTIISTNAGNRGNAHSEYIGPLAESGVLGTLTFILIAFVVIYRGVKLYSKMQAGNPRLIVTGTLLGLITYLVHGMLNNFLDTDKASVPFWGFIAIITVLDIKQKKLESTTANQ